MTQPRTLALAIRQMSQQRLQLSQEMSQWQLQKSSALGQLDQLSHYAQDMQNFVVKHPHRDWHPAWFIQHHQFLARLEDAIQRQTLVLDEIQAHIERCEERRIACEQRQRLLQRWDEHQQQQGVVQASRRNQHVNDELAQRFVASTTKAF